MTADLAEFEAHLLVGRNLSPKTAKGYVRIIRELGATPLEPEAIERWSTGKGGAASTVGVRLSAVKAWCRFLRVRPNPTADILRPKRNRGLPRPVAEDWHQYFKHADPRLHIVAVFLAETGLRITEACSINVPLPVPWELRVLGKGRKTRKVPLTEEAHSALTYFGGKLPWGVRAIQRRFQLLSEVVGVPITAHMFRHRFGCDLAESGADVADIQKLMGHASPATTMGYADFPMSRQIEALDRRVAWQRKKPVAAA